MLDGVTDLGHAGGKDHPPHLGVDVVEEDDLRGQCAQSGEKNGMPFQISTSPSPAPIRPSAPDSMVRGKTA